MTDARNIVCWLVLSLLGVGHVSAQSVFATAASPMLQTVGNATTFNTSSGAFAEVIRDRAYLPNGSIAKAVTLDDLLKMPHKTGAHIGIARVAGAAAIGTTLATAIGIGMTAAAIADIANDVRCKQFDGVTGCDDGADPETTTTTEYTAGSSSFPANKLGKGSSPGAACSAAAGLNSNVQSGAWGSQSTNYTVSTATPTACNLVRRTVTCSSSGVCDNPGPNDPFNAGMGSAPKTQTQCPASIDASNPANNIPAGEATGADGKCKTGRYAPKTPDQVRDKIADLPDTPAQNLRRARGLEEAIKAGGKVQTDPGTASGPASIVGQPTTRTTTGPEGTTTTTRTPTTRFGYNGPTVTADDDATERTVNPDGSITETTESGLPPVEPAATDCDKYPTDLGCVDLGSPPSDKPEWSEKTVTFANEDIGLTGSCPPPYVFNVRSWEMKLNYQAACDIAPVIRAGVLALTALGCMLWMFTAVKV